MCVNKKTSCRESSITVLYTAINGGRDYDGLKAASGVPILIGQESEGERERERRISD